LAHKERVIGFQPCWVTDAARLRTISYEDDKWLDEPVPALGNRTPRQAARLKTICPKLIALLKDLESQSERQRRAGQPAYDSVWLWKELGITRE
jgi:hypothetical protein